MKPVFTIRYSVDQSRFGYCLVGVTERKEVCLVAFLDKESESQTRKILKAYYPEAAYVRDDQAVRPICAQILSGKKVSSMFYKATPFQDEVWQVISTIKKGSVMTYKEIAERIGRPKAVRAVGTACGNNPVAYLIPCHRVIASDGSLGGYRWGMTRKEQMLKEEGVLKS